MEVCIWLVWRIITEKCADACSERDMLDEDLPGKEKGWVRDCIVEVEIRRQCLHNL